MKPQKADHSKSRRQEAIRKVIRSRLITTQGELGSMLAGEGFRVTQATLSRDLQQLGALRVSRPGGATAYELEPVQAGSTPARVELGQQILSVSQNDALVVLRTRPGMASAVALAIDVARLPQCLGTLAGDDTIFATPARGTRTRQLSQLLRTLFGTGETP